MGRDCNITNKARHHLNTKLEQFGLIAQRLDKVAREQISSN